MATKKKLTFALMDPPFENARTVTTMRLIDIAARRGHEIIVFAYEGAVGHAFAKQAKHANAAHGHDLAQENHPLTREWVANILAASKAAGGKIDWINCGLCVDERGVAEFIPDTRRGSPADLLKAAEASDNSLVIGTRG